MKTRFGFNDIVPNRRIDFIFASSQVKFIQHRNLADTRDGLLPSDYLPVQEEIEVRL